MEDATGVNTRKSKVRTMKC